MFFGEVHSELVEHFSSVPLESPKECTTPINHNEAKLTVIRQQSRKSLEDRKQKIKHNKNGNTSCLYPVNIFKNKLFISTDQSTQSWLYDKDLPNVQERFCPIYYIT